MTRGSILRSRPISVGWNRHSDRHVYEVRFVQAAEAAEQLENAVLTV